MKQKPVSFFEPKQRKKATIFRQFHVKLPPPLEKKVKFLVRLFGLGLSTHIFKVKLLSKDVSEPTMTTLYLSNEVSNKN